MTSPLRFAHGNILFGSTGGAGALYRLDTVSALMPEAERLRHWRALAGAAYELRTSVSLYRVTRQYPAERYAAEATKLVDARHADPADWNRYLTGQQDRIAQLRPHVPEVYLVVALPGSEGRGRMARTMRAATAGRKRAPITGRDMEGFVLAEQSAFSTLTANLGARRATTLELQWLIRRAAFRGLAEPPSDEWWQPAAMLVETTDGRQAYEPVGTDLLGLQSPPLMPHPLHVEVESEAGTSFQAFLTLGAMPASRYLESADLLSGPLERLSDSVDAVVHARYVSNDEALGRVRRKVQAADSAWHEASTGGEHGALSHGPEERRGLARELLAYLESDTHPPLLLATTHLATSGDSRDELEAAVGRVRHEYGSVRLNRLVGRQHHVFLDCLPRVDAGRVDDGRDVLTVEQFGALLPTAANQVGSEGGPYVAYTTRGKRPVRFDTAEASHSARPPATLIAGIGGSGKTQLLELIEYQTILRGGQVIDIDPKPDHHLEDLPELAGRVDVIDLGADESCAGMLDPLQIVPGRMGEDLGTSYLLSLLPGLDPTVHAKWSTAIRRHVRQAISEETHPTMTAALHRMLRSGDENARAAGEAIEVWADSPLGQLGFAKGPLNGNRPVARRPLTTVKAHALSLPDATLKPELYTERHRVSVATFELLVAFGMSLARADRSTVKVLGVDEGYFLLTPGEGRRLISWVNYMGRALRMALVLAVQRLDGIEDIEELVGTRFFLGQKTGAGAKTALRLADLDPEDDHAVARQRAYRKGAGVMVDVEDRRAEIQVDLVYRHILEGLDTTPKVAA